jgi:hypothetical protein
MEDTLTLEELYLLVDARHREEHRRNRFAAAMQGVDIDEGQADADFERVQRKAAADLAGKTEDEFVFSMIGIEVESDEDD